MNTNIKIKSTNKEAILKILCLFNGGSISSNTEIDFIYDKEDDEFYYYREITGSQEFLESFYNKNILPISFDYFHFYRSEKEDEWIGFIR